MTLRLNGSTSGYVEIDAPATAGSNTLVLPDGNGTANYSLVNDGSGNLSWFNGGPAFRAYGSTATAITASTLTKVLFQTEDFDTASCFSSSRFTPNLAGYYSVSATVRADISNQTALHLYFTKNGASYAAGDFQNASASANATHGSTLVYLNGSTDYLEVYVFSSVNGNTNNSSEQTWFAGFLARPA